MFAVFITTKPPITLLDILDELSIFIEPRGIRLEDTISTARALALMAGICLISVITVIAGLIMRLVAEEVSTDDPIATTGVKAEMTGIIHDEVCIITGFTEFSVQYTVTTKLKLAALIATITVD